MTRPNVSLQNARLTSQRKQNSISSSGTDLCESCKGFVWLVGGEGKPVAIDIDDVRYE